MYILTYIHTHTYMHTLTHTRTCIYLYKISTHTYVYTYIHTPVNMYTFINKKIILTIFYKFLLQFTVSLWRQDVFHMTVAKWNLKTSYYTHVYQTMWVLRHPKVSLAIPWRRKWSFVTRIYNENKAKNNNCCYVTEKVFPISI